MKKLLMLLALLPLMAAAETEIVDGIEWNYAVNGGRAQIVCEGGGWLAGGCPTIPSSTAGAITIPSALGGYPVTSIGEEAFCGCDGLTLVMIPEGVTSIGRGAFEGCLGLTSVEIPSTVTKIGARAFFQCKGLISFAVAKDNRAYSSLDGVLYNKSKTELIQYPQAKVCSLAIPSSVTSIGERAFADCRGLRSLSIPSGVTSIGKRALSHCVGLTEVTVAKDNRAFCMIDGILYNKSKTELIQCFGFKTGLVTIPTGVTSIGNYAFYHCEGLTSVRIPSGVTRIGEFAFGYCLGLTSVTIPSSVTIIETDALANGLDSLSVVYVGKGDAKRIRKLLESSDSIYLYGGAEFSIIDRLNFIELEPPQSVSFLPGEVASIDTDLIGYTVKGLPSGLKYNKTTGMITGAATKPTAAGGVIVKFTKSGAETEEMTIVVGPTPKIGVALEGDTDGCKVTGAGAYLVGKKVTLKVTTKKGTAFTGFYKDGKPWPNEADCKKTSLAYTMGKDDVSLVAKFEKEKMSVGCVGLSDGSFTAGVAGSPEGIPLEIKTQSGIKSVKVEKLPAGMKYDAKTQLVTGAPTKAGDNMVVITVTAVSGAVEKKEIAVPVAAMPGTAVGTFNGFVANGEQRIGTFTLTTTDAGRLTAKVITAGGTVSFSGTCWDSLEDGVCKVTLRTKKGEFMTLALDSNAAWDANQLTGTYSPPNMTGWFDLSAQRNAFGKTWYFTAAGDEQTGWTFAYTKDSKAAALTVTLKADGSTAIAGKLGAIKVGASGYANAGGMREGAIIADFAPIVTVNKVKRALSIRTNLWFDRSNDHAEGVGGANLAE